MHILAHRGFWVKSEEKNSLASMEKAFTDGFGVETDIRDYEGLLVISHDIANSNNPAVEELFRAYKAAHNRATLALNVKADGLQCLLKALLEKYSVENYFLFDMSIPEMVVNEREHLRYYTRHSDIENDCVMYDKADGVWLDSFYDEAWLTTEIIEYHLGRNKRMCIASPELHGHSYEKIWGMLKLHGYHRTDLLALCTDIPDRAKEYFNE